MPSRSARRDDGGEPSPHIRDLRDGDRPGLRALWEDTWRATYGPSIGQAAVTAMMAAVDASDLRDMLPGRDERAFVATTATRLVGSAIVAERRSRAYLWGLYVRPEWQRRGVGTALLSRAIAGLCAGTIEVSVLTSSPWAIAFYERHRFARDREDVQQLAPDVPAQPCAIMTTVPARLRERLGQAWP